MNDYIKVLETNQPLYVTNRGFQYSLIACCGIVNLTKTSVKV